MEEIPNTFRQLHIALVPNLDCKALLPLDVYLVNPTADRLEIKRMQGSFQEDFNLGTKVTGRFFLPANSFHLIDTMCDSGELDFTTWYRFVVKREGKLETTELMGEFSGWSLYSQKPELLSLLNKPGILKELRPLTQSPSVLL